MAITIENQIIGNSIMISANADITPKWKAGVSTGYDFVQRELHLHNFALKRFTKLENGF
jgi:hypothetical protein